MAYVDALGKRYKPQLKDLRKRHDSAEGSQRAELAAELERIEAEYQTKLDSIDDSAF